MPIFMGSLARKIRHAKCKTPAQRGEEPCERSADTRGAGSVSEPDGALIYDAGNTRGGGEGTEADGALIM